MTVSMEIKKGEVFHGGRGIFFHDEDGNALSLWFPELDAAQGLEMLDQLRDELQAIVLDELLDTTPEEKK